MATTINHKDVISDEKLHGEGNLDETPAGFRLNERMNRFRILLIPFTLTAISFG